MYLILSILLSIILCFVLLLIEPIVAALVFAGIVLGVLFRGLYLLHEIHAQLVPKTNKDKVQAAVNQHLEERASRNQS